MGAQRGGLETGKRSRRRGRGGREEGEVEYERKRNGNNLIEFNLIEFDKLYPAEINGVLVE